MTRNNKAPHLVANIRIGAVATEEWDAVLELLAKCDLPRDGLPGPNVAGLVARASGEKIVGCAALEWYRPFALLRSVAVEPRFRGKGVGERLALAALRLAQQRGATHVYLLTETAADFFPKFGFREISRRQVPRAVQASIEFTSACPDSALAMEAKLPDAVADTPRVDRRDNPQNSGSTDSPNR